MTVNQEIKWRKDRVSGKDKYYPKELIDPLIKTVRITEVKFEAVNASKRNKKQKRLRKNLNL